MEGGVNEFVMSLINIIVNNGFFIVLFLIFILVDKLFLMCDLLLLVDILGKIFVDVYISGVVLEDVIFFFWLYYMIELGVVGFEGWEGEMWVLDCFEEQKLMKIYKEVDIVWISQGKGWYELGEVELKVLEDIVYYGSIGVGVCVQNILNVFYGVG